MVIETGASFGAVLLVENREIFIPNLYLSFPQGVTPSEFREYV